MRHDERGRALRRADFKGAVPQRGRYRWLYTQRMAYGIAAPDVIAFVSLCGALYVTYLCGRLLRRVVSAR
jgi:hypothetical protein